MTDIEKPSSPSKPLFSKTEKIIVACLALIFLLLLGFIFNPQWIQLGFFNHQTGKIVIGILCLLFATYATSKAFNPLENKASRIAHLIRIPILISASGACFYLAYLN